MISLNRKSSCEEWTRAIECFLADIEKPSSVVNVRDKMLLVRHLMQQVYLQVPWYVQDGGAMIVYEEVREWRSSIVKAVGEEAIRADDDCAWTGGGKGFKLDM
jgi:hypothetical protein